MYIVTYYENDKCRTGITAKVTGRKYLRIWHLGSSRLKKIKVDQVIKTVPATPKQIEKYKKFLKTSKEKKTNAKNS